MIPATTSPSPTSIRGRRRRTAAAVGANAINRCRLRVTESRRQARGNDRVGARRPVPVFRAERPLSDQTGDPGRDAGQRARRADSGRRGTEIERQGSTHCGHSLASGRDAGPCPGRDLPVGIGNWPSWWEAGISAFARPASCEYLASGAADQYSPTPTSRPQDIAVRLPAHGARPAIVS